MQITIKGVATQQAQDKILAPNSHNHGQGSTAFASAN